MKSTTVIVRKKVSYYIVNGITLYRFAAAPFLFLLLLMGQFGAFKWLVTFSFFTDAIDGPLARKYKVSSVFGSRLDSVADDATVLVSILGLWMIHPAFIEDHWIIILGLLALFAIQTTAAIVAYGKVTSFHTYMAKVAAVFQGLFFVVAFFNVPFALVAFYAACLFTAVELIEEIILVLILPEWKTNVKGLYWMQRKQIDKSLKQLS